MIKTFLTCIAALAASATLSACMTPGASSGDAGEVPASRIFIKEMTMPAAGLNEVRVIRDPGMRGGNNLMEVSVNYVALADLQPGESFSAWLPNGNYTFTIKPKPNPQSLIAPRDLNLALRDGRKRTVRVGGNMYGTILEEIGAK
jgi:hypothetical protein